MVFLGVLVGAIFLHELGHAIAMRECGVRIKAFLIGIPVPYLTFSFTTKKLERLFGEGFVFRLSPLLLGGGVMPHEDGERRMEKELSYREYAYICGAGPLWNIFAITVVAVGVFLYLAITRDKGGIVFTESQIALSYLQLFGLMTASSLAFWVFRRFVCGIILPVLGLLLFVLFVQSISADLIHRIWESGNLAYVGKEAAAVASTGAFVKLWSLIHLALFTFNIFPLFPLDGGRIVNRIIDSRSAWAALIFRAASGTFVVLLIVLVVGADINKLF